MKAIESSPKKPYHKSTEQELEARIRWVEARLREAPVLKHTLLRNIKDKFNVSRARAEAYVSSARERLLISLQQTKAEFRATSLTTYESILASNASAGDKVKAQNSIDELLGLKAPYQSQLSIDANVRAAPGPEVTTEELLKHLDLDTKKALLVGIRKAKAARGIQDGKPLPSSGTRPMGPARLLEAKLLPAPIEADWSDA